MPKQINIQLLKHQEDFVFSEARHTGLVAGFGGGKTFSGIAKSVIKKMQYPQFPVAYYLPSYPLIRDIAFPKFKEFFETHSMRYKLNETHKVFTTDFGTTILRSMDEPETIVGYEVAHSLIDECDILPIDKMTLAFVKIVARNRAKLPQGHVNQTDVVGTPEGFRWFHKFFVKENKPNRVLIRAKTLDNPFLPEDYIETLQDIYTIEQLSAYLNGEFVNMNSGSVYKNYNRDLNNTEITHLPNDTLHVGMDFNISNMGVVIHIIRNEIPYAVNEVVGAFDTSDLCRILKERFSTNQIIVYPDASGNSRKTSSGITDHQIIRSFGFNICVDNTNPPVRDRINCANLKFKNNQGEIGYFVNVDKCPNYVESLEQLAYKNSEPDKSSGFDHLTDAGTYFIWQKYGKRKRVGLSI